MKSNQNQNRMDEGCKNARGKEKEKLETRDSSGSCRVRVPMEQQRDKLVVRVKLSELASKRAQSSIPQPPAPPPAPPANKNGAWEVVGVSGEVPGERYGHAAAVEERGGGVLLVFAGCDPEGQFSRELLHFNFESGCWGKSEAAEGSTSPSGRHFHSAVWWEGGLFVFGGMSNGYYNDIHVFHLDSAVWSPVLAVNKGPSPRFGHSAIVYNDCMYIFGGYDKDGFECNDLWEFDLRKRSWRRLRGRGIFPKERYHHAAVVHNGSMYIFGGKKAFNEIIEYRFSTETWALVEANGAVPRPRWGHSAVVWRDAMWVFGGRDSVTTFSDLYRFHFESGLWERVGEAGWGRAFHTGAVHGDKLYAFGGFNIFHFCFNDLLRYNLLEEHGTAPNTFVEDMGALLNDPTLSDVVFIFPRDNNKKIYAHKNILSSRCAPLSAMLQSGMKESCGVIEIEELDYNVFFSLLQYLYTGNVYAETGELVGLLRAADQYQLERLKWLCGERAAGYVDTDNAAHLLMLADQLRLPNLSHRVLHFLARHYPSIASLSLSSSSSSSTPELSHHQLQLIHNLWKKKYENNQEEDKTPSL